MDVDDVEVVDLNALGGTDTITVNDLTGTDVVEINVDLAGTIGGTAGDGQADTVIVNGTNGDDIIDVFGAGTSASVLGLAARVNIANSEGANDSLVVNALGGDDGVTATTLPAGVIKLTIDGGAGEDDAPRLAGRRRVPRRRPATTSLFGDNGNDLALMGAGDDVVPVGPGRRQRHARGPGRRRHDAVLRRQRRREHRHRRQRRPRPVPPRTSPP